MDGYSKYLAEGYHYELFLIFIIILLSLLQYFNSGPNFDSSTVNVARVGGSAAIADYCPYHLPFSNVSL